MKKTVETSIQNGVMTIVLNNLEMQNGTTYIEQNLIADAFEEAMQNDDVRVIVFTGTDEYFHTGGRMPQVVTSETKLAHINSVSRFENLMDKLNKPLISAVNGECSAGGMSILMKSDIAISVDDAMFGFSEALRGGFPAMILNCVIDNIPKKRLLESCYTGDLFTAQDAYMFGLINKVVTKEQLKDSVAEMAQKLCRMDKDLQRIGRKYFHDMLSLSSNEREQRSKTFLAEVLEIQTKAQ